MTAQRTILAGACLFVLALAFGPAAGAAPASGGAESFFRPMRTGSPPAIDGRLDEAVWREAPAVNLDMTFSPDFGRQASERTVARMAYDAENLYFAFKCYDREPDKIKAAVAGRDTITSDDFICINLDSFNDQQSLYAFYVNPLGIQADSRYAGGTEDFSVDFVWTSAGRIDPDGYSVEMAVPFKSIRYAGKRKVEMSIFFERRVSRRAEHCSYPALDPAQGNAFLTQMMPLELEDIKRYTLVEVLPAYTYRDGAERVAGSLAGAAGVHDGHLTGKLGLTSQLILDATYNPDFSQIEADAGQVDVNLRTDLYFPEKRPFFLEGSEMFQLAGTSGLDPLEAVVYTRTIIDPRLGFKLSGKIGAKDTIASILALDESPASDPLWAPGDDRYAGFGILRYKRALAGDGYLGLFSAGRTYGGGFNEVGGADGQVRLSRSSQLSFHGFGSWTRTGSGDPAAGGLALGADYYYDTRDLGLNITFYDISGDFETATGYLTRPGVAGLHASVQPRFYPKSRFLRKIVPFLNVAAIKDLPSGLVETNDVLGATALLPGNTTVLLQGRYSTEVFLGRRFDTSGGGLLVTSQVTKAFSLRAQYSRSNLIRYVAEPYAGSGSRASGQVTFKPSEKFDLAANLTYADFTRRSTGAREYDYAIWRGRLGYQPNRYLQFRAVVEYNAFRRELLTDFLASFVYVPGTVLQLGYGALYDRTAWIDGEYRDADRFLEMKRGLFIKASYLWRL
ncbi:MAG TPA: DUF5916 domain-containing protein [Candidatus Aminicenantes bacterium]|nr:DUF5916 domain-containing protein [Candidatus Aminicenantes bacterium]HRY64635.1 DUF5916 domain-containing protein [Candidatus Aminicenantes bacterium]HRZ71548.1 DUF5916 domain-containing protein [Candidatus Aminicenantes bacterium]